MGETDREHVVDVEPVGYFAQAGCRTRDARGADHAESLKGDGASEGDERVADDKSGAADGGSSLRGLLGVEYETCDKPEDGAGKDEERPEGGVADCGELFR